MTNAETIAKLNDALEKLIKGYEELQNSYEQLQDENNKLNSEVSNLKDKIADLEENKRTLEDNVNELQDNTEKDSSNISSMLDKIEGLLSKRNHPAAPNYTNKEEESNKYPSSLEKEHSDSILDIDASEAPKKDIKDSFGEIIEEDKKQEESSDKIDLNRMASLLNGFNK